MISVIILNATARNKQLFTPKQFQLEGGSIKNKLQKIFKGTKKLGKVLLNQA